MKTKNSTSSASAQTALYANPLLRKVIHSVPASQALARLLGPRRCGQAVGHLLKPFVKPGAVNVLAVGRELFFKDTEQVERRTGTHFIPWRSGHLGRLQAAWTPRAFHRQGYFFAAPGAEAHPCWAKSEVLIENIHRTLEQAGRVPVMMSANIDYWQETALRKYCTDHHVAHLVLCRENLVIPHFRNLVVKRHRECNFRFHGQVAVFSETMKQVFLDSGACRPEQVDVTGAPRTDVWQDERPAAEQDTVLLLSFRTSLFPGMFVEAVEKFIETARQFPDLHFVVKCKEGRGDYDWMLKKMAETGAPVNLRPEQYGDLRGLMERSKLIIGFNTLALTEALLTDAVLMIPAWHDTDSCRDKLMMDPADRELQEEIRFCTAAGQFHDQLQEALRDDTRPDRTRRLRLMNRYMHYTPGETASRRVADRITQLADNP